MLAQFPIPILSVAADAVRDLEGRDALSGLWTLFTKCKESLQDGQRLENISWRLWYREMMLVNQEREFGFSVNGHLTTEKENLVNEELILDEKSAYQPSILSESVLIPPPLYSAMDSEAPISPRPPAASTSPTPSLSPGPFHSPLLSPSIPEHKRRASSSRRRRSSFLNGNSGTPVCVGKMIYDMLPSSASASSSSSNSTDSSKGGMAALFLPGPVISRNSTSTLSTSASAGDIKVNPQGLLATPFRLDPKIQMTPIAAAPSSLASPPSVMPVVDGAGVRPTKCSIPNPPPLLSQHEVSYLPTPEMEEAEPEPPFIRTTAQNSPVASSSHTSSLTSSSSTIPAPATIATTSLSVSNISNGFSDISNDANDSLPVPQATYTGPPSPSLSDSYARAHPGEVDVKDVELMPSLSNTNTSDAVVSASQQQTQPQSILQDLSTAQTPPSSASSMSIAITHAPSSSTLHQPPKLVVVNPTPNPTPHPTPPATPLLGGTIGPGGIIKTHWLTLPEGAAGSGARQHQILQAAQHQIQQMQAARPHLSALRVGVTSAHVGQDTAPFDRSQSAMGATGPNSESGQTSAAVSSDLHVNQHVNSGSNGINSDHGQHAGAPIREQSPSPSQPHSRPQSRQSSLERDRTREREEPKNKGNRYSMSSTTSSNHSHISDRSSVSGRAESTTTDTTLSSEAEQYYSSLVGLKYAREVATQRLGSLSTIQSMSTLVDRKKEAGGDTACEVMDDSDGVGITVIDDEVIDDEAAEPLSPLPPPGGLAMSPRRERRKKRNRAPPPVTSSSALLALSPTASGSGQPPSTFTASPKSISPTSVAAGPQPQLAARRKVTAAGAISRRASSGRSTSLSRSAGGSSIGDSRSRSRDPGVGLGGFGMTSAAPAVVAPARKAPMVAGGRGGRAKVVLGRAGSKARGALRRNSSGVGAAATAEADALDQELEREQVEREQRERMKAEALEKERQRNLQQTEDRRKLEEQTLAISREREAREERLKAEEEERMAEERQRHRERLEALAAGGVGAGEAGSSKRPVRRFNIGSNSDHGSGVDSKSAGSASDVSGGHRRGEDLRTGLSTKAKGKERQREMDQQDMAQQLHHQLQQHQQHQQQPQPPIFDHLAKDQQNLQQQLQRQMSKQQLHQLQKMHQLHQQHQNQSTIHQHQPQHQHQQQFQLQPQQLQQGLTSSRQVSTQQFDHGDERVGETQNGKGKEKEVVPVQQPTKSTSKVNVALDDDLAAKVKQSLAAPLLPQNARRTIVLATSESEFETDSEDEGSWSSEEISGDENEDRHAREEQLRQQELQQQQLLSEQQQQIQLQRQLLQQQQPVRPPGVQRTQSSHYPAPNARGGSRQVSRNQQRQAQLNTQAIVEQAALEAQRQRDMFVKLPTSSFQDLAKARTRSVGLLTQLMNPNPDIFPVNHPYRRGFSSGEIRPAGAPMAPMRPLAPVAPAKPQPILAEVNQAADADVARPTHHRRNTDNIVDPRKSAAVPGPSRTNFSPPSRAIGMHRTKSAAALPISSQIMAGSVSTKAPPTIDLTTTMLTNMHSNGVNSSGYRPKGPPKDQELEEDSGSEAEAGIQVSKSVAQEKLKALAYRSRILPNAHRNTDPLPAAAHAGPSGHADDDDVPQWARVSQPYPQQLATSPSQGQTRTRRTSNGLQFTQINHRQPPPPAKPNAAPIPLGYPYNLPPPVAPSTPRTTRRQMLSHELTESLRRNLLWERQVSKVNLAGVKRSASGGGSRHSILGGLQPLTTAPSMVQLHAKGTGPPGNSNDDDREMRRGGDAHDDQDENKRQKAMARNKSWANDYHYSGW